MFDLIKAFFSNEDENPGGEQDNQEQLALATYVVLREMADADQDIAKTEQHRVNAMVKEYFKLNDEQFSQLKTQGDKMADESIELHQFTIEIKNSFSEEQRKDVMDMLWRVVLADGKIDKYEEDLCRQLTELLGLEHSDMIESKLKALLESKR